MSLAVTKKTIVQRTRQIKLNLYTNYGILEKGILYIDTDELKKACHTDQALKRYNLFMSMVPTAKQHAAFLNHTIPNPISIDFDKMYEIVKDLTASSLNQIKISLSTYIAERLDASNKHHADYLAAIYLQNIALLGQDNSNPTHSKNILLHAVINGIPDSKLFQTGGDPESILKIWWEWITSKKHHLLPAYFVKQDTTESFINDNDTFGFKEKLMKSLISNPLSFSYISWYVKQIDKLHTGIENLCSSSICSKYLTIPSAAFDTRLNKLDTELPLKKRDQILKEEEVTPESYLKFQKEIKVCDEKIDELIKKQIVTEKVIELEKQIAIKSLLSKDETDAIQICDNTINELTKKFQEEDVQQLKNYIAIKHSYNEVKMIDEKIYISPLIRPLKLVLNECGYELNVTLLRGNQIYDLKPMGFNKQSKSTQHEIQMNYNTTITINVYHSIYMNELSYLLWNVMKRHTLDFATIYVEQKTVTEDGKLYFVCHKDTKLENNFNPDQYISNPKDNYLCFQALQPRQCKLHEIKELITNAIDHPLTFDSFFQLKRVPISLNFMMKVDPKTISSKKNSIVFNAAIPISAINDVFKFDVVRTLEKYKINTAIERYLLLSGNKMKEQVFIIFGTLAVILSHIDFKIISIIDDNNAVLNMDGVLRACLPMCQDLIATFDNKIKITFVDSPGSKLEIKYIEDEAVPSEKSRAGVKQSTDVAQPDGRDLLAKRFGSLPPMPNRTPSSVTVVGPGKQILLFKGSMKTLPK